MSQTARRRLTEPEGGRGGRGGAGGGGGGGVLAYSGEKGSSEARPGEWGRESNRRAEVPVVIAGLAYK